MKQSHETGQHVWIAYRLCSEIDSHISHSCRNVLLNPFKVFILKTEHRIPNYSTLYETNGQNGALMMLPIAEPTSLLSSFWEPLESGFEPLIFIPSEGKTIIGTWL